MAIREVRAKIDELPEPDRKESRAQGKRIERRLRSSSGQRAVGVSARRKWAYSAQAGFDTLVLVVERASGQKFDQFARQRIFEPLGMKDTFFYPADSYNPRIATLYRKTAKGLEKQANPNFMYTTAEERRVWNALLGRSQRKDGRDSHDANAKQ
jgi:CubicO group peptidase (beta-lactamase class C family)